MSGLFKDKPRQICPERRTADGFCVGVACHAYSEGREADDVDEGMDESCAYVDEVRGRADLWGMLASSLEMLPGLIPSPPA